jgi:hypothetical protein
MCCCCFGLLEQLARLLLLLTPLLPPTGEATPVCGIYPEAGESKVLLREQPNPESSESRELAMRSCVVATAAAAAETRPVW